MHRDQLCFCQPERDPSGDAASRLLVKAAVVTGLTPRLGGATADVALAEPRQGSSRRAPNRHGGRTAPPLSRLPGTAGAWSFSCAVSIGCGTPLLLSGVVSRPSVLRRRLLSRVPDRSRQAASAGLVLVAEDRTTSGTMAPIDRRKKR